MQPGARVHHFEIVSLLGRGGMGEVWRARDLKLRRDVALKTLPPELAGDPDRLQRLEREATSLASLNHPNIASIHGLEEQDGHSVLVLELVEGDTLADRLRADALGVEQALKLGVQIAEALEAAHERGIVHRDLKPANVKVTPDGRVKVLDFGLAKMLDAPDGGPGVTHTALRTEVGALIGTPAYMSPEQAAGSEAGRQADIWSFGVLLYEMLTGTSPFAKNTTAETLASVLGTPPDFTALPAQTPAAARRVLRRCLEKDRKRRAQHIGDVRIDLEDALAAPADAAPARPAAARRWGLAAALVLLGAMAGGAAWWAAGRPPPATLPAAMHLSIPFAEAPSFLPFGFRHLAITTDGSRIAYSSAGGLMVFDLSAAAPRTFPMVGANPFFSPDGEWLGYVNTEQHLTKISTSGGAPEPIVQQSERVLGASWGTDGKIVFATTAGLFEVADQGGAPRLLAKPSSERGELLYAWPRHIPGSRSVLLTVLTSQSLDAARIVRLDLDTLEPQTLLTGGVAAQYVATGYLVYASGQSLHAVRFDPATNETRGAPIALANTPVATAPDNGAAEFAISHTGTLLSMAPRGTPERQLVWVDRQGHEEPLGLGPAVYANPRVSPDGRAVALEVFGSNRDIWIWNLQRRVLTRFTNHPSEDLLPLWTPDGTRLFFASNRAGTLDIYSQAADGSGEAKLELGRPEVELPNSFTPDGKRLVVFEEFRNLSLFDFATSTAEPLVRRDSRNVLGEVSPDGRWLAHESDESGQLEILLRPFPDTSGRREKVSLNGGRWPRWGLPGSGELYYVAPDGALMAAAVELSPTLRLGGVQKLFDMERPPSGLTGRFYDISPIDGRFLVPKPAAPRADGQTLVAVTLNWLTELQAQAQRP